MTPTQAVARTAAIHAVAALFPPRSHDHQTCPCAWRFESADAAPSDCDCWVLPRATEVVDTVLAELARGAVS